MFFFGVVYAVTLTAGLLSLESPQQAIQDPFFSLMEMLIVVMAPLMVIVMVAIHISVARNTKLYSLTALAFMIVCATITSSVHFGEPCFSAARPHSPASCGSPSSFRFGGPPWSMPGSILAWNLVRWPLDAVRCPGFTGGGSKQRYASP